MSCNLENLKSHTNRHIQICVFVRAHKRYNFILFSLFRNNVMKICNEHQASFPLSQSLSLYVCVSFYLLLLIFYFNVCIHGCWHELHTNCVAIIIQLQIHTLRAREREREFALLVTIFQPFQLFCPLSFLFIRCALMHVEINV